jgi:hypothetical protein
MSDVIKQVQIKEFNSEFESFTRQMLLRFIQNNNEKGILIRENLEDTSSEFLRDKLAEHFKVGNFVDCANYCFLLYLKYGDKKQKELIR